MSHPAPSSRLPADQLHFFGSEHTTWPIVRLIAFHRMRRHTPIKPHRLYVYEIVTVESGELRLRIEGRRLVVDARHFGIIPPNHVITHGHAPNVGTVYWLGLAFGPQHVQACDELVAAAAVRIQTALDKHGVSCLPASDGLLTAMREGFSQVSTQTPPLSRHAALLTVLAELDLALQTPAPDLPEERMLIDPALRLLKDGPPAGLPIARLADACHMSRTTFNAIFKRVTGMPPHAWINRERVRTAAAALRRTNQPVEEIARTMGFSSPQHFSTVFKTMMGVSPTTYRKQV